MRSIVLRIITKVGEKEEGGRRCAFFSISSFLFSPFIFKTFYKLLDAENGENIA
jgi:hypothetical protein